MESVDFGDLGSERRGIPALAAFIELPSQIFRNR